MSRTIFPPITLPDGTTKPYPKHQWQITIDDELAALEDPEYLETFGGSPEWVKNRIKEIKKRMKERDAEEAEEKRQKEFLKL